MTIAELHPIFHNDLKHFVFYITNGTLIIEKGKDYRSQILSQGSFANIVYSFCSQINFDEFDKDLFTCIGKGLRSARETIKQGSRPFGKTNNFLDFIVDFAKRLSEGSLIAENQPILKEAFENYIFNPTETELIFSWYCELAELEGDEVINHEKLCHQLGLVVDPNTEFNYDNVVKNMLPSDENETNTIS